MMENFSLKLHINSLELNDTIYYHSINYPFVCLYEKFMFLINNYADKTTINWI